jgi:hypothetical protein
VISKNQNIAPSRSRNVRNAAAPLLPGSSKWNAAVNTGIVVTRGPRKVLKMRRASPCASLGRWRLTEVTAAGADRSTRNPCRSVPIQVIQPTGS